MCVQPQIRTWGCALIAGAIVALGAAGTAKALAAEQLADINPGGDDSFPDRFTVFGDELIFRATDGTTGSELWRYDGTSVTRLADINPGAGNSNPGNFTVFGSELIFSADDGTTGSELWLTKTLVKAMPWLMLLLDD